MSFSLPETGDKHILVDPCAGDGEAIATLRDLWFGETRRPYGQLDAAIHAIELEKHRAEQLRRRLNCSDFHGYRTDRVLEACDAFHTDINTRDGASLLFLNPPYDLDKAHGRLEQRFLERWTQALLPGSGVLMFLVPYYALAASAHYLSCHFSNICAWRFPGEHFHLFRQCALLARRREISVPENLLDLQRIEAWAADSGSLPELTTSSQPLYQIFDGNPGLMLEAKSLDLPELLQGFQPWQDAPFANLDRGVNDMIGASYTVAMPPRPAHIALALSAGMLNGKRITGNRRGLPPLLVKGSIRRDFIKLSESRNKHGELVGTTQVQHPKLSLSVLRLDTLQYHELKPGVTPSRALDVADFNSADLVTEYGESLGRLMRQQFPAIHDLSNAAHDIALPQLGRQPYRIQRHAIIAGLKLLALGENPEVIAEVGTGKSTVSLTIAGSLAPLHFSQTRRELQRIGFDTSRLRPVHKVLVVCPPHLLKSWTDQARAVLPDHKVVIVEKISDLKTCGDIFVLSRETAKLSHGVEGLPHRRFGARCPKCGASVARDSDDLATTRARCGHVSRLPINTPAKLAEDLAACLVWIYPFDSLVRSLVQRWRMLRKALPSTQADASSEISPEPAAEKLITICRKVIHELAGQPYPPCRLKDALQYLSQAAHAECQVSSMLRAEAQALLKRASAARTEGFDEYADEVYTTERQARSLIDLAQRIETCSQEVGQPLALRALSALVQDGQWKELVPCEEPLFQAVPRPRRRFPLARYILRHCKHLFDLLILDELHEYSASGSAQQKAAHRLVELPGVPTIALTGSLMGGYASSLFANFWALSPRFRRQFRRSEKQQFIRRYGYRRIFVPAGQEAEAQVVGYGINSDRENIRESQQSRQMGEAPGILPLFILEHLLPVAVFMHKEDLDEELPPCKELPIPIYIGEDDGQAQALLAEFTRMLRKLTDQIKADRYTERDGKLWGAMSELPSYLDRATDDLPPFLLKYPDEVEDGAHLVEGQLFPSSWVTPKERWMLDQISTYLSEGRNVLVFLRHTGRSGLPRRFLRLFKERLATSAVFLDVTKVKAAEREAWLDANVIKPGRRILITNPRAVATGLNNLVHFSRAIWAEGVDYDARVVRQANGRIHRIGQLLDVVIEVPYYAQTPQQTAFDLVARKLTASEQVDGLSLEGALENAGAGTDDDQASRAAMGIGQAIYDAWVQKACPLSESRSIQGSFFN